MDEIQVLASLSYDQSIKLWSLRQGTSNQNPVIDIKFNEKIFCGDIKYPMCIIGFSNAEVAIFDIKKIKGNSNKIKLFKSPLMSQTTAMRLFYDKKGFAIASNDGRANLSTFRSLYTENKYETNSIMTFKCHKQ